MRAIGARLLAGLVAVMAGVGGAAAQTLQSDDPSFISLGAGAFDVLHNFTAGEFRAEYRSSYKILGVLKPFAGVEGTTDGGFYGSGGFLADIYFGNRFVLTPNAAVGYYAKGDGKDLGSHAEFRTGAEFAYRFDDRSRLGIGFNHISNAGISKQNPGEEELMLVYSIPLNLLK